MTETIEDVRVAVHSVPYSILVSSKAREETKGQSPKYLGRKGTEVLKEGKTEWSADRSAASARERWKDLRKPSVSGGRRGSTN